MNNLSSLFRSAIISAFAVSMNLPGTAAALDPVTETVLSAVASGVISSAAYHGTNSLLFPEKSEPRGATKEEVEDAIDTALTDYKDDDISTRLRDLRSAIDSLIPSNTENSVYRNNLQDSKRQAVHLQDEILVELKKDKKKSDHRTFGKLLSDYVFANSMEILAYQEMKANNCPASTRRCSDAQKKYNEDLDAQIAATAKKGIENFVTFINVDFDDRDNERKCMHYRTTNPLGEEKYREPPKVINGKTYHFSKQELYINVTKKSFAKKVSKHKDAEGWIYDFNQKIKKLGDDDIDRKVTRFANRIEKKYCPAIVFGFYNEKEIAYVWRCAANVQCLVEELTKEDFKLVKKSYQTTKPKKLGNGHYFNLPLQIHAGKKAPSAFWLYGPYETLDAAEDDRFIAVIGKYRNAWDMDPLDVIRTLRDWDKIVKNADRKKDLDPDVARTFNHFLTLNYRQLSHIRGKKGY